MIAVTRIRDGEKIYINPKYVCAIYPNYHTGVTIIQFPDDTEDNYFEVAESVDEVAKMIEGDTK